MVSCLDGVSGLPRCGSSRLLSSLLIWDPLPFLPFDFFNFLLINPEPCSTGGTGWNSTTSSLTASLAISSGTAATSSRVASVDNEPACETFVGWAELEPELEISGALA